MRNGGQTRENIVRQAAGLFNRQGFAGASMADIMAATGLQKGGIYRHFESKEALALEAFDYAVDVIGRRFSDALAGKTHALDRLRAVVGVFAGIPEDPPVPGGCPMMNAMIESDDAHPALRDRTRSAMDGLRGLIARTVAEGIAAGEVRPGTDGDALASVLVATMEGAVALSQAYADPVHVRRAAEHLEWYLEERVRA
jgi:AcrR family transcriptional regulator